MVQSSRPEGLCTLLKTITMPADIDASGQVPAGWMLAKMDSAGATLPAGHFTSPVHLVAVTDVVLRARPQIGQSVTFVGCLTSMSDAHVEVFLEAWSEDRAQNGETQLLSARLRYEPTQVTVPENLFPGTFSAHP